MVCCCLLTNVTALGDCHRHNSSSHFSMCASVDTCCRIAMIHDGDVMGRSQQNSSNGSYSCNVFFFFLMSLSTTNLSLRELFSSYLGLEISIFLFLLSSCHNYSYNSDSYQDMQVSVLTPDTRLAYFVSKTL